MRVEDDAQVEVGLGILLDGDRLAIGGDRLVEPLLLPQHVAQVGERLNVPRLDGQRAAVAGFRLVELLQLLQHDAQVVVGFDEVRLVGEGLAEAADGGVELLLLLEHVAEIVVGLHVGGLNLQGPLIDGRRIVGAPSSWNTTPRLL